jgi:hypothetical protein
MTETLADWLTLREPADHASRSGRLTRIAADALPRDSVRVLDLATGTGSNIRYLAEHLPPEQHWLVTDRDPALLAHLRVRMTGWATPRGYTVRDGSSGFIVAGDSLECRIETRQRNLASLEDPALFEDRHLVTASALLDLVSDAWLRALAAQCRASGATALFTLTYDGRSPCAPEDSDDKLVRDLFNDHQRTDKGLGGVAAGPGAIEAAARAFTDQGFRVDRERSDWVIGPDQSELQRQLIADWMGAATEIAPELSLRIANWQLRRLHHVDEGESLLVVGHEDLVATRP